MQRLLLPVFVLLAGCGSAPPRERLRSYEFTCDYFNYDAAGNFKSKTRVEAGYTPATPGETHQWSHPSVSIGSSFEGAFNAGMPQDYMEGFSYADPRRMLDPDFFKSFPATPFVPLMKNLVYDTHMFDGFARELPSLKPNEPHRPSYSTETLQLGGDGQFQNNRIELTRIGESERNGEPCALIRYQTSVNRLKVDVPGGPLVGSSVYWGELWVSKRTGTIEHATLYETVLMGPQSSDARIGSLMSIYREGTFRRVAD